MPSSSSTSGTGGGDGALKKGCGAMAAAGVAIGEAYTLTVEVDKLVVLVTGASEARRGIFDLEFSSSRRCSGLEFHDFS